MFRPASRLIARQSAVRAFPRAVAPSRRLLSTAPPTEKSRSWKSLVARLGIAGAIIYYYNSTDLFAEEPRVIPVIPETETETETEILPTIDAIAEERKKRKTEAAAAAATAAAAAKKHEQTAAPGGVEDLEEEADQQGAFNPETGEINWDCPCLGGMAHGPCGEEFKAAFSCFVYSTEEPKGMDCVEKFKDMQNCFRQYPEIYGSELDTDEEDDVTTDASQPPTEGAPVASADDRESRRERAQAAAEQVRQDHGEAGEHYTGPATKDPQEPRPEGPKKPVSPPPGEAKKEATAVSESDEVIPKAWHDDTDANVEGQKTAKTETK